MNSIEKAIQKLISQSKGKSEDIEKPVAWLEENSTAQTDGTPITSGSAPNKVIHWDFNRLEQHGYVTPGSKHVGVAEEFRGIKRPLVKNAFGGGAVPIPNANMIMMTSSLPGEGKTFMTLNLALSMVVEKDTTLLLVDGDLANPTMSRLLGVDDQPGLTDLLNGEVNDIGDILMQTDIPELRFIPAGRSSVYSTELLASERMKAVMHELSERYKDRVILFDSSPLLITSQSIVLSHLVGQIVVVVEAGKTPKNLVKDAVDLLGEDDVVSLVLNKHRRSSFGGYYYGAYYGAPDK